MSKSEYAVSVAIMHVPRVGRDQNVADLLEALSPAWDVTVITDPTRAGCWPTAMRAWAARSPAHTHHLVLEDDVALCDHFQELLLGAITARPTAVMSLCTRGRGSVDNAVLARCSWLHSTDMVFGQGIVIPTADVDDMLSWAQAHVQPSYEHGDGRVGMWTRATGRGGYTPVPQLVRHKEGHSLMGHPYTEGLGTALFAADRRDVNWDTDAFEVPGSFYGGSGLRADVPSNVAAMFARELRSMSRAPVVAPDAAFTALKQRIGAAQAAHKNVKS